MRPIESYEIQGREAYCDDQPGEPAPYPKGSLREISWTIGWLQTSGNDPLALPDDDEFAEMDAEFRLSDLKSARRRLLSEAETLKPSLEDCLAVVGPADTWPMNCFAVATQIFEAGLVKDLEAKFGRARVCYGIFAGYISEASVFERGVNRHGWIEFEDGLVLDPTRWVFAAKDPSISLHTIDDYDLAASRMMLEIRGNRPVPAFSETERRFRWDVNDAEITALVASLLGNESRIIERGEISLHQARWLGNLPVGSFGEHAAAVYGFYERAQLLAMVPVDNRNYVSEISASPAQMRM